ncbi:hypothetical protein [Burkholderia gladioli]|uniref:hypothetical protein n=1 Tax=Burkholderia gladioli TaxID=28095 RepID=UPI00163FC388|nr:hypothetical protein [Burkholderia gladioli]
MNTTRLRQGGLIAMWTLSTVGIGMAVPWLVATLILACFALCGGAVAVQQTLASLATVDGLQWRTGVPVLWTGLTWLSVVIVFAYRITHTRWVKDAVDRMATRAGAWIENRSRALYVHLGGTPNDAGRHSIALVGTLALVLIAGWLWLLNAHNPSRRKVEPLDRPPVSSAALVMPSGSVVSGNARIDQVSEGVYRVTFGDRLEASQ